ncbi:SMI1/KNR4 family protein [Streptomyces sp. NRRL F-5123]|uniref:SMI1/KNR4 family protein n=1 Tax=Streptomyces sp. NRRL F-5123 TaxID=1463856 RepID=UPI0004E1EEA9|nr:SMI1/KNR4 family protein [Streptomyces sp. NRRL F-5123]
MTNRDLEQLTRLLPPPAEDVSAPPWGQSRADVGFDFPSDYRAFVDLYGGGHIGGPDSFETFDIYAPSAVPRRPGEPGGFEAFVAWHTSEFASMFEGADADFWGGTVYPMYPAPGGLLTWGENEQGDLFWWLTEGDDPDAWPVVMWARGPATTYRFDVGMVRFLYSMVSGDTLSPEWLHLSQPRWVLTSDWRQRGLNVSADPSS